jgi:hypothetical protein
MKKIMLFCFFTFLAINAFSHTGGMVGYTCPLCNTKFESYTQFSGTSFGQNLDLRRYGAIMVPAPIPKCPNCSFVFDDDFFTNEEITKIKIELGKNNIFIKEPNMPNYYYLAREEETIGKNTDDIIWWFLSGVWENKDESKKNKLIDVTIEYINKLKQTDEAYNNYQLVKLDLLRRSGQFEKAIELIGKIKMNKEFYKDYIVKIIDLQMELIKNKNQEEHSIP